MGRERVKGSHRRGVYPWMMFPSDQEQDTRLHSSSCGSQLLLMQAEKGGKWLDTPNPETQNLFQAEDRLFIDTFPEGSGK